VDRAVFFLFHYAICRCISNSRLLISSILHAVEERTFFFFSRDIPSFDFSGFLFPLHKMIVRKRLDSDTKTMISWCYFSNKDNTMSVKRFGISLDASLLKSFDRHIAKKGYASRSEAIRDLIRDSLVKEEGEYGEKETVGSITIIYSHDTRELTDNLTDMQHDFHTSIISSMHVHLDHHNCLEVIIVKGKGRDIKNIADRLIGIKGVKHGKLSLTTTGRHLK